MAANKLISCTLASVHRSHEFSQSNITTLPSISWKESSRVMNIKDFLLNILLVIDLCYWSSFFDIYVCVCVFFRFNFTHLNYTNEVPVYSITVSKATEKWFHFIYPMNDCPLALLLTHFCAQTINLKGYIYQLVNINIQMLLSESTMPYHTMYST